MIAQYQGKKLIKKATKKEEEKIEKSIQAYYNEYKMSQWNRWAKEFGLIPNIKAEDVRNGFIITRRIKGLTPKRLFWDRSAIKEQKKLEQEQQEIMEFCIRASIDWDRYKRLQESLLKATAEKVGVNKRKLKDYLEN